MPPLRPLFTLFLLFWVLTGCVPKTAPLPALTESVTPFLSQVPAPLKDEEKKRLYADFLSRHYAPWQMRELNVTRAQAAWAVGHYAKKRLYGENRLPLSPKRFEAWVENADYGAFNRLGRHAVTVYPTSLRLFPTMRPIFYDPSLPGEGYPFDYNQNSAVKAMTPLIVSHLSRDGGWAFVQTPFALGWVPIRDIAWIDEAQIERIMRLPKTVVIKEHLPVYDRKQSFLFYAKLATLFPVTGAEPAFRKILIPRRSADGTLRLEASLLPEAWGGAMPLPMTRENLFEVAKELLGEPYGWGGMVGDRDCSAMTRDFFAPFGIWLPRNSRAQAKVGRVISLKGMSDSQKEKRIVEEGIPFHTLLYLPGHIMLYVGHSNGRAYVMHNLWGIRTEGGGRHIVGRAVVTDLHLGENLPEADKEALLIKRVVSMNIVTGVFDGNREAEIGNR